MKLFYTLLYYLKVELSDLVSTVLDILLLHCSLPSDVSVVIWLWSKQWVSFQEF